MSLPLSLSHSLSPCVYAVYVCIANCGASTLMVFLVVRSVHVCCTHIFYFAAKQCGCILNRQRAFSCAIVTYYFRASSSSSSSLSVSVAAAVAAAKWYWHRQLVKFWLCTGIVCHLFVDAVNLHTFALLVRSFLQSLTRSLARSSAGVRCVLKLACNSFFLRNFLHPDSMVIVLVAVAPLLLWAISLCSLSSSSSSSSSLSL